MQAEREELVKRVFPQVRALCESRGVTWTEVDLRWGLTDEDVAQERTLDLCLAEVRNCQPFFLAILGGLYGWIPPQIPPEMLSREPWLADCQGRSVTELEILCGAFQGAFQGALEGALEPADAKRHALFYIRSPDNDDDRENAEARQKLADLKERVRASGFPVREGFRDAADLGELVMADLVALVDELFPADENASWLDRETSYQAAFAASRRQFYVPRPDCFRALDEHVMGEGPQILAVAGDAGAGKSALLANWLTTGQPVVTHFLTGQETGGADWETMLRVLIAQLSQLTGRGTEPPSDPQELRAVFGECLQGAGRRLVLVIDGLDRLADRDGAPDLVWLPDQLPGSVRLIASTTPGRPLDELRRRGCRLLNVAPLDEDERRRVIVGYLANYRKRLDPGSVTAIAQAGPTGNAFFLCSLLEELRVFGVHERLRERIAHYTAANDSEELFYRILARWEKDYEQDRPGLVRDTMSLLWASRNGLAEGELLDLLGAGGAALPHVIWSPLHLAAGNFLLTRSGLVGFSHDALRAAVWRRYLGEQRAQAAHRRIADYFATRDLVPRKIEELPWQLSRRQDWGRLASLLADPDFLSAAWADPQARSDVSRRWRDIEAHSRLRAAACYRPLLDALEEHGDAAFAASMLLWDLGQLDELFEALTKQFSFYNEPSAHRTVSLAASALGLPAASNSFLQRNVAVYALLGNLLRIRGHYDAAEAFHRDEERYARMLGDQAAIGRSLGNRATLLRDRYDLDAADALNREAAELLVGGEEALLGVSLDAQAQLLEERGDLDGALDLYRRAERTARAANDARGIARSLGHQAIVRHRQGDADVALKLHREEERLFRELGDQVGIAVSLLNQSALKAQYDQHDAAKDLAADAEAIARRTGVIGLLARVLLYRATIGLQGGDLTGARAAIDEALPAARRVGAPPLLSAVLEVGASVAFAQGDLRGALACREEQEQVCRRARLGPTLFGALYAQVFLFEALFVRMDAEDLDLLVRRDDYAEKLGQAKRLGNELGAGEELWGRAARLRQAISPVATLENLFLELEALTTSGERAAARERIKEAERLARRIGALSWMQPALPHWLVQCQRLRDRLKG